MRRLSAIVAVVTLSACAPEPDAEPTLWVFATSATRPPEYVDTTDMLCQSRVDGWADEAVPISHPGGKYRVVLESSHIIGRSFVTPCDPHAFLDPETITSSLFCKGSGEPLPDTAGIWLSQCVDGRATILTAQGVSDIDCGDNTFDEYILCYTDGAASSGSGGSGGATTTPSDDNGPCCKMCSEQACGDSCISATSQCTKDYGCACDSRSFD